MLVSHSHKFIFIKSKKTAGSSIQDYLAPYCKKGIIEKYYPTSHRSARSTREKVGEEVWNSYLKICPVRNPWDKMVSWYFWRSRKRNWFVKLKRILKGRHPENEAFRMSFKDYLLFLDQNEQTNIDKGIIFIDGEFPDYFFIRYEYLHEDLEKLCSQLGIPYRQNLPKEKVGIRKNRSYKGFYDEESREIVGKAYSQEIEEFGYTFD